ncbi:MAG TPA: TIGR03617 family F420-dependent LLM class oxidoreductase [bacterium]|jgi:probable F420-dependent oxidoreductase
MKVDAHIAYDSLHEVPALARAAEALGVDGIWFSETAHDPFLGAALAAEHTQRVSIGTSVAVAFTRSPTVLAHTAWDLAALAGGRFILGLGTQVKAHITRRFSMPWEPPAPKLRETVEAVRSVWETWRTGRPLQFHGRFYTLTLMTPFFTPPAQAGTIPIVTAGVNPAMCRTAGAVADGFHVHPFHTPGYLRDVIRPALAAGRRRSPHRTEPFSIAAAAFAITGDGAEDRAAARERVRRSIAFYASTPSYRAVLAHHGWDAVGAQLSALAARGRWTEMPRLITDEILTAVAVEATDDDVGGAIVQRYRGLVDRIGIYEPFNPDADRRWRSLIAACRG